MTYNCIKNPLTYKLGWLHTCPYLFNRLGVSRALIFFRRSSPHRSPTFYHLLPLFKLGSLGHALFYAISHSSELIERKEYVGDLRNDLTLLNLNRFQLTEAGDLLAFTI